MISSDKNKIKIVQELKRSDSWWRFARGDVLDLFWENLSIFWENYLSIASTSSSVTVTGRFFITNLSIRPWKFCLYKIQSILHPMILYNVQQCQQYYLKSSAVILPWPSQSNLFLLLLLCYYTTVYSLRVVHSSPLFVI